MRLGHLAIALSLALSGCALFQPDYNPPNPVKTPLETGVVKLNQGSAWNDAYRAAFYTEDQGSRIMPLAWFKALRQPDGSAFDADQLARYGYLPDNDGVHGLPLGFTTGQWDRAEYVGMTCAACHTRQLRIAKQAYRVDGGPGFTDLFGLFSDLDAASQRVLNDPEVFAAFASEILGKDAPPPAIARLRTDFAAWAKPYHTLISRALFTSPWGVGRADAVSMILNRAAGLDIGTSPDRVIADNIAPASAPVRYPFIWNAAIQDRTQWPGFAANGNDLLGLIRNVGEVYGVFGVLQPTRHPGWVGGVDYITTNSGNFVGLDRLEKMIRRIGAPAWPLPWGADHDSLAAKGRELFWRADKSGQSCASCHEEVVQRGIIFPDTWKTPLVDVGTDSREYGVLGRVGQTGVLRGASLPILSPTPLKSTDSLVSVLKLTVGGAILQKAAGVPQGDVSRPTLAQVPANQAEINHSYDAAAKHLLATANTQEQTYLYESRVLKGIWAAGPYLHNGSVPTLADLFEPAANRPASFDVGADYDPVRVGVAATQSGLHSTTQTTGCDQRDSGNSRCGHEFGTEWSGDEKRALIEYLKTL